MMASGQFGRFVADKGGNGKKQQQGKPSQKTKSKSQSNTKKK